MKLPDKRFTSTGVKGLESKKGERKRLSGDIAGTRSPFLEFNPNSEFVSEDAALDYLTQIIVEIYLTSKHGENSKEGGDLLPGLNKRAG